MSSVIRVSVKVIVSTLAGILAGGAAATVYFTVMNLRAEDGPYFPPALVASVVVIPVAFVLLPFQLAVLAWQRFRGPTTLRGGLAVGAISGLVAGLTLAFVVFASPQHSARDVLHFILIGLVQGCATLVCLACLTYCWQARQADKAPNPIGNEPAS